MGSFCPYCGAEADDTFEETVHMESHHPDVIRERLRKIGVESPVVVIEGEAKGAIPNGKRIFKINSEPGDGNPDGTPGVVVSSIKVPEGTHVEGMTDEEYGYFVYWSTMPGVPVFIRGSRIEQR